MSLQIFTTSNGIKVFLDHVPNMKNIDIQLVVHVGSVDEPDELAGICHALEHCTHLDLPSFKGTPSIDQFANRHAFVRNAATNYTRTTYYTQGLALREMLQLLGELTFGARFNDIGVAAELKSIRREALTDLDDIEDINFNFWDYVLSGVTYGRDILGYHDRIDFTAEQLRKWYERYYTPDNMSLVVVGDVSKAQIEELSKTYLHSDRTSQEQKATLPPALRPYPDKRAFAYVRNDSNNARLCLQTAVHEDFIRREEEASWAYAAARTVLSDTLLEHLRYNLGLSYDGYFGYSAYNHRSSWRHRAEVTVDIEQVDATFEAMREIMGRSVDSYPDDRLQEALASQAKYAANDTDNLLSRTEVYASLLTQGSPVISTEESYEELHNTKLEDVRQALEDTLATWHSTDVIECVTGPKEVVGDRFVIEQSLFA